jgi:hypothetical protein
MSALLQANEASALLEAIRLAVVTCRKRWCRLSNDWNRA